MTQAISDWVVTGGLIAIFVLMLVESCGIPIPGEVTMPLAGYFVAQGHLDFVGAVLAGVLGNLVGSLIAYVLTARFGEPLLLGPGRKVGISPAHLALADGWFSRWGLYAVFFGRVLPVVRTYISFPAGLARVKLAPFVVLTFIGALPWCALLTLAGYEFGANYDRVSGPIGKVAVVIAVAVAGLIVWWFVHGRHVAARRREETPGVRASCSGPRALCLLTVSTKKVPTISIDDVIAAVETARDKVMADEVKSLVKLGLPKNVAYKMVNERYRQRPEGEEETAEHGTSTWPDMS